MLSPLRMLIWKTFPLHMRLFIVISSRASLSFDPILFRFPVKLLVRFSEPASIILGTGTPQNPMLQSASFFLRVNRHLCLFPRLLARRRGSSSRPKGF